MTSLMTVREVFAAVRRVGLSGSVGVIECENESCAPGSAGPLQAFPEPSSNHYARFLPPTVEHLLSLLSSWLERSC